MSNRRVRSQFWFVCVLFIWSLFLFVFVLLFFVLVLFDSDFVLFCFYFFHCWTFCWVNAERIRLRPERVDPVGKSEQAPSSKCNLPESITVHTRVVKNNQKENRGREGNKEGKKEEGKEGKNDGRKGGMKDRKEKESRKVYICMYIYIYISKPYQFQGFVPHSLPRVFSLSLPPLRSFTVQSRDHSLFHSLSPASTRRFAEKNSVCRKWKRDRNRGREREREREGGKKGGGLLKTSLIQRSVWFTCIEP